MAIETERKFLTVSTDWKKNCVQSISLRDGLIASVNGRKVRVRIADHQAFLTVKGARIGYSRDEFEYEIPMLDAERLLELHCEGRVVTKTRHLVEEDGFMFEVDVYDGLLEGVTIAEAELSTPEQSFPRPSWLGEEVTGREEFRKINMLRDRLLGADKKT
jgi:adenylate cyclase